MHEKEIAELMKKKATLPKKKKKRPAVDLSVSKIRSEYEQSLKRLPGDLTSYELRVSADEIIIELSKKHKISPDSVKKIINNKS
jgi:hypothetical protein